jgi:hypothetical protein
VTEGHTPPPSPGDFAARRPVPGLPGAVSQVSPAAADPSDTSPGVPSPAPPAVADPQVETAPGGGTGDDRVDAALRRLDAVEDLPVSEHVAQYDALHRTLQDALAAIDEG